MRATGLVINFFRRSVLLKMLGIVIAFILLFGIIIHSLEPDSFPTVFDGIWWSIVTVATVGYGDYVPTSVPGRIAGVILILIGVGLATRYFAIISTSTFSNQNAFNEGKSAYRGNKHIIIIGWNERVKETVTHLSSSNGLLDVILIDESLEKNPLPSNKFHFIKGNPTYDTTLKKANITEADMVLITADQSKDEVQADMQTILTLIAIKGLNPNIYSIVEVLTMQQVTNAKRAGADEIVQTNRLSSFVMVNSILSHGISDALLALLVDIKGCKLHFIEATFDLIEMTFKSCNEKLLKEGKILIGLKREGEIIVNPPLSLKIHKNDHLLVIKN